MNIQKLNIGKAYYHQQMMKIAYTYLPIFSVVVLISSAFENLRFFLYLTFVGATYGYILQQMKKKYFLIEFTTDHIILDQTTYNFKDIESYYLSLPSNVLLMLRIRTKNNKDIAIYIDKNLKETIEEFFRSHSINPKKINYDNYLQYGHLLLAFAILFICFLAFSIYNFIYYKILN